MKIQQLDIEGFKSLKKVTWKPGDLNVIIGPNGSGKSNLLQALELLSISAQGKLERHIQGMGGMRAIAWDGQDKNIVFRIEGSQVGFAPSETTYTFSLVGETPYFIWNELLSLRIPAAPEPEELQFARNNLSASIFDKKRNQTSVLNERVPAQETLLSQFSGRFVSNIYVPVFQSQLAIYSIYQDMRVDGQASIRQPVVTKFEKHIEPNGQNLINVLHTLYTGDREFKQAINSAMSAAFGEDFNELIFAPAGDQRIQLRIDWKTLNHSTSSVALSDGTLRFLLLIAVLANPEPAPLIAIDEPETGLHPSMLPIIAEYAVAAAQRTQVVFTTHSDQFLDAFTDTKPTTTVIKWADGETTLTTLDGEELAYWLEDYSLGKLFHSGHLENMG